MDRFDDFDPDRPLVRATTVLEASAGTGKTHAITDLAVRLLGDGSTTIDRLLLVTFGRDARRPAKPATPRSVRTSTGPSPASTPPP